MTAHPELTDERLALAAPGGHLTYFSCGRVVSLTASRQSNPTPDCSGWECHVVDQREWWALRRRQRNEARRAGGS